MEKEKVLEKFPLTAVIVGLVLEFCFIAFFMVWQWMVGGYSPYSRDPSSVDPLADVGIFIGFLILLTALMGLVGKRLGPNTATILYVCSLAAWPMAYYGVMVPDTALLAKVYPEYTKIVPSYWYVPAEEASKIVVGGALNVSLWTTPLFYWGIQLLLWHLSFVFLALIWRKRLLDVERLPFPTAMPIYETINVAKESEKGVFKEKMLWAGFGLAWVLYIWDILRVASRGAIPRIPLYAAAWFDSTRHLDITPATKTGLIGTFNLPIFFGFFFLPLDILFTLWVTQLFFYGILPAVGIAAGVFPDVSAEGPSAIRWGIRDFWWVQADAIFSGVVWGIGIWTLWAGRDYLKDVFRSIRGKKELDEPVLSYKLSILLLIVFQVILFLITVAAGSSIPMMILYWPYMIIAVTAFTRIRAEFWAMGWGPWFFHHTHWWAYSFIDAGTNKTTEAFVTTYFVMDPLYTLGPPQGDSYGSVLDAFKVSKEVGGNDKWSLYAFISASIIGLIFAISFRLLWGSAGFPVVDNGNGQSAYSQFVSHVVYQGAPEEVFQKPENWVFGIILAIVLGFLKARYIWWPLNPVGMVGALGGWVMPITFFSVFGSWVFKYVTMRVGGTALHRRMLLLCAGFIGGYFLKELIGFLVGMAVGLPNIPPPT